MIYYFQSAEHTVYLLLAYDKTEADDISAAGRALLKSIVEQL